MPYLRDFDDSDSLDRSFDRVHQHSGHLCVGDQTEAIRAGTSSRKQTQERVKRLQKDRPAATGSKDIPRPENSGIQFELANALLNFRPRRDMRLHDRGRLRHAYVNKVTDSAACRCSCSAHPAV